MKTAEKNQFEIKISDFFTTNKPRKIKKIGADWERFQDRKDLMYHSTNFLAEGPNQMTVF